MLDLEKHHVGESSAEAPAMSVSSSSDSASSSWSSSSYSSLASSSFSPPSTPHGSSARTLRRHQYLSHDSLGSLYHNTIPPLDDDKFTQMPVLSPRERRSSSVTMSASRRRKSLASLASSGNLTPASPGTPISLLTPSRYSATLPKEGKLLSRRHIEACRRSAKEALEEDLRSMDFVNHGPSIKSSEDYALDCYLSALDYLLKSIKLEDDLGKSTNSSTRRAIRARLQLAADSLTAPEELVEQQERLAQERLRAHADAQQSAKQWSQGRDSQSLVYLLVAFLLPISLLPSTTLRLIWTILLMVSMLGLAGQASWSSLFDTVSTPSSPTLSDDSSASDLAGPDLTGTPEADNHADFDTTFTDNGVKATERPLPEEALTDGPDRLTGSLLPSHLALT